MTSELQPIILTAEEIKAITGALAPSVQLNELRRLGFTRARRGMDRGLILERAHYEAVCAGAVVLPPSRLPKAAEVLLQPPRSAPSVQVAVPPAPAPQPPQPPPPARGKPAKVPLKDWAALNYSPPPSYNTLTQWRRTLRIFPEPELVGNRWFVAPDAKVLAESLPHSGYVPLVERLKARGM